MRKDELEEVVTKGILILAILGIIVFIWGAGLSLVKYAVLG